jgi:hypothetical protein
MIRAGSMETTDERKRNEDRRKNDDARAIRADTAFGVPAPDSRRLPGRV